jgi:hypothetical protein
MGTLVLYHILLHLSSTLGSRRPNTLTVLTVLTVLKGLKGP